MKKRISRKVFYFNYVFIVNTGLLFMAKWTPEFGYFSIGLYTAIVVGNEATKYIKGKTNNE